MEYQLVETGATGVTGVSGEDRSVVIESDNQPSFLYGDKNEKVVIAGDAFNVILSRFLIYAIEEKAPTPPAPLNRWR